MENEDESALSRFSAGRRKVHRGTSTAGRGAWRPVQPIYRFLVVPENQRADPSGFGCSRAIRPTARGRGQLGRDSGQLAHRRRQTVEVDWIFSFSGTSLRVSGPALRPP